MEENTIIETPTDSLQTPEEGSDVILNNDPEHVDDPGQEHIEDPEHVEDPEEPDDPEHVEDPEEPDDPDEPDEPDEPDDPELENKNIFIILRPCEYKDGLAYKYITYNDTTIENRVGVGYYTDSIEAFNYNVNNYKNIIQITVNPNSEIEKCVFSTTELDGYDTYGYLRFITGSISCESKTSSTETLYKDDGLPVGITLNISPDASRHFTAAAESIEFEGFTYDELANNTAIELSCDICLTKTIRITGSNSASALKEAYKYRDSNINMSAGSESSGEYLYAYTYYNLTESIEDCEEIREKFDIIHDTFAENEGYYKISSISSDDVNASYDTDTDTLVIGSKYDQDEDLTITMSKHIPVTLGSNVDLNNITILDQNDNVIPAGSGRTAELKNITIPDIDAASETSIKFIDRNTYIIINATVHEDTDPLNSVSINRTSSGRNGFVTAIKSFCKKCSIKIVAKAGTGNYVTNMRMLMRYLDFTDVDLDNLTMEKSDQPLLAKFIIDQTGEGNDEIKLYWKNDDNYTIYKLKYVYQNMPDIWSTNYSYQASSSINWCNSVSVPNISSLQLFLTYLHNNYPISIVDEYMSEIGSEWCNHIHYNVNQYNEMHREDPIKPIKALILVDDHNFSNGDDNKHIIDVLRSIKFYYDKQDLTENNDKKMYISIVDLTTGEVYDTLDDAINAGAVINNCAIMFDMPYFTDPNSVISGNPNAKDDGRVFCIYACKSKLNNLTFANMRKILGNISASVENKNIVNLSKWLSTVEEPMIFNIDTLCYSLAKSPSDKCTEVDHYSSGGSDKIFRYGGFIRPSFVSPDKNIGYYKKILDVADIKTNNFDEYNQDGYKKTFPSIEYYPWNKENITLSKKTNKINIPDTIRKNLPYEYNWYDDSKFMILEPYISFSVTSSKDNAVVDLIKKELGDIYNLKIKDDSGNLTYDWPKIDYIYNRYNLSIDWEYSDLTDINKYIYAIKLNLK